MFVSASMPPSGCRSGSLPTGCDLTGFGFSSLRYSCSAEVVVGVALLPPPPQPASARTASSAGTPAASSRAALGPGLTLCCLKPLPPQARQVRRRAVPAAHLTAFRLEREH